MTRVQWVRNRMVELAVAMTMVYVVTAAIDMHRERQRESIAPMEWFEVHEVFVPDHVQGSDPELLYDRTIKQPFTALWVVEAQRREPNGRFANVCSGAGLDDYEPSDELPDPVTWEWFFDRECAVPPGQYRLAVVWDMRRAGYPMKRVRARSNIFTISD